MTTEVSASSKEVIETGEISVMLASVRPLTAYACVALYMMNTTTDAQEQKPWSDLPPVPRMAAADLAGEQPVNRKGGQFLIRK